jgi:hypothetical protein
MVTTHRRIPEIQAPKMGTKNEFTVFSDKELFASPGVFPTEILPP